MSLDLRAPVAQLAQALVDIPSVSGNETELADLIESALEPLPHLAVTRLGDAVVARTELGRAERVVIAGHIDTVPIAGKVPATMSADGTRLIGRGSVDMKSGVAVQLSLAAALTAPQRDVTWVFYDHEEVDASLNGLGRIASERPDLLVADFAILCEPTSGAIEGGCNGTLRCEVTVHGTAAHSARAWKGVNAIHLAGPLIAALGSYEPMDVTVEGLTFREGLNAVGIRGGIAGNVIPDACVVTINHRFAPDKEIADAKATVESFVAEALGSAGGGRERFTLIWTDESSAARPGLDSAIAAEFTEAVAATGAPAPMAKQGWTDVARFGALGIPAVNYGPGDPELAHSDSEQCPIDQIESCREALAAWLGR